MNWSGSVRVPSVLQYSTKLANFIADYIAKTPETEQLNELLYFIWMIDYVEPLFLNKYLIK
jgi:hypothetical protein